MKRNRFVQLLCAVLLLTAMVVPASADTGPKPSVVVEVQGLDGQECWGTLLSDTWTTGPHSSMYRADESGTLKRVDSIAPDYQPTDPEYPMWKAFSNYAVETFDMEGTYFLGDLRQVKNGVFTWGYYPPDRFKVALYFPEVDALVVSDAFYERYAFDSYYAVDLSQVELVLGGVVTGLTAVENYDHAGELEGLVMRIGVTVVVELLLALAFGIRGLRAFVVLLLVNLATQIGLNVTLNLRDYLYGAGAFQQNYVWMELLILMVETAAYWLLLPMKEVGRKKFERVFSYALAANFASYAIGWVLAYIVPGMF